MIVWPMASTLGARVPAPAILRSSNQIETEETLSLILASPHQQVHDFTTSRLPDGLMSTSFSAHIIESSMLLHT